MSARPASYPRARSALGRLDLDRLGWPGLAVAVVASGGLLFHLTRGTSFWTDEWLWIVNRRSGTLHTFLAPYNGHLSVVPIAIYHLLFAGFGLTSYTPYRAVAIALSLIVGVAVFVYARSRTGAAVAVLAGALMLFLGPGWQDTMWGFQIPWLIVCLAMIGALMLLERRSVAADIAACALILLAISSTSLGLAFAAGIIVELALTRRRLLDVWIWAVPLVPYIVWVLAYHPSSVDLSQIPAIPPNVAQAAAAAMSSLLGVSGIGPGQSPANAVTYGWPLLVVAAVIVALRLRRSRPAARVVSLAVVFVVFVASTSVAHFGLAGPFASRYLYVDCLLVLLLAVELAAGARPSAAAVLVMAAIVAFAIVGNLGSLRAYGAFIRASGQATDGALAGLDLDRAHVDPRTVARIANWQFLGVTAGSYYAAARALGSPAYSLAALRGATAIAQSSADAQLLADGDMTLERSRLSTPPASTGSPPAVLASSGGAVTTAGTCLRFTPAAALAPGAVASLTLRAGPAGISVSTGAAAATLSVRRFAPAFTPLGTVGAQGTATVRPQADPAPDPWYAQLSSIAPVRICALPS